MINEHYSTACVVYLCLVAEFFFFICFDLPLNLSSNTTPLQRTLHWLHVAACIRFKTNTHLQKWPNCALPNSTNQTNCRSLSQHLEQQAKPDLSTPEERPSPPSNGDWRPTSQTSQKKNDHLVPIQTRHTSCSPTISVWAHYYSLCEETSYCFPLQRPLQK